jgi:hypothetical protein
MESQKDEQETYSTDEAADTIVDFFVNVLPPRYEPPSYFMNGDAHVSLNTPARVQGDNSNAYQQSSPFSGDFAQSTPSMNLTV